MSVQEKEITSRNIGYNWMGSTKETRENDASKMKLLVYTNASWSWELGRDTAQTGNNELLRGHVSWCVEGSAYGAVILIGLKGYVLVERKSKGGNKFTSDNKWGQDSKRADI
jgi:hypothetical protein